MKAVRLYEYGGPENLKYADLPKPAPGPGQALVKIAAAGVNFIDCYFRTGLYKADPPVVLGNEGAGTVESAGPDVTDVKPGDRVAYAMSRGSYSRASSRGTQSRASDASRRIAAIAPYVIVVGHSVPLSICACMK